MGKLDSNKKKKETSLLDTAFELFTTKGLTKTSISDIVSKAGVAKGTFYLYFKDKYDLRNHLISHKSSQMFRKAIVQMKVEKKEHDFESDIIFVVDNIINQLCENKSTLSFISKNLSWGVFKNALTTKASEKDVDFADVYNMIIENAPNTVKDPEIMVYMIIELVSSTCYSAILYSEPCDMQTLKPYLYGSIKHILHDHIEY
ncbi:TetR/AcrR family transcriptional regulator [Ruminococcus sp. FC2018]|uniref:TetR/AcrR family transcriptional regulator n=1 Tax=Ruminococcus sp. FC2018 TaxID=1410617 RepID=UPI00048B93E5|nr:TetR/AcrR family transcriptional regulator [Ruminococcus sp. FC2018]